MDRLEAEFLRRLEQDVPSAPVPNPRHDAHPLEMVVSATHRAVIQTSYPPEKAGTMLLIASGTRAECHEALNRYIRTHPLNPYEVPLLLVVDGAWLPTTELELTHLIQTDPGVAALFDLARIRVRQELEREYRRE